MDRSATPWRVLDDAAATEEGRVPAARGAGDAPGAPATLVPGFSWRAIGGLGLAAALGLGAFVLAASGPGGEISVEGGVAWTASGSPADSGRFPSAAVVLVVDVQGAVLRPGVLQLAPGSRVADAIAAAGGYGPRVDAERAGRELNLATELHDGDRIVVPSRDDPAPAAGGPASGAAGTPGGTSGGLVDLNSATAAELDELPGVGPVTAQKIIDARTEKPFATVDELRERKIVGPSTFEKLRDLVTVR
jgi:competence protein ComEA